MPLVDEAVIPFTSVDEELVTSLASQAAVAFENTRLIQDIKNLFDSFVRRLRDRDRVARPHHLRPLQARGHPHRGHRGDGGRARQRALPGRRASRRDQLQEIHYASLLHDFGKVGVREKVLIKGKKLYVGEMLLIRQRFDYIKRTLEAEHLRAKLEQMQSGPAPPELLVEMDRDLRGAARGDRRSSCG